MKRLSPSLVGLSVAPAVFGMLLGCGGGGGSASPGTAARSTFNSKTRLVQATRVSRTLLALTGLGRTITRAAAPLAQASFSISWRQRQILALFSTHRNAGSRSAPALDPATGLYYTTQLLANGSGQQLLYTDQALTRPAGTVMISTPKWAVFPSGAYPANISENCNITAGSFAGVSGTLQATVGDAAFTTGRCVLAVTDQDGDAASGDFTLSGEEISGKCKCKFKNGDSCDGTDLTDSGGNIDQSFTWPDDCFGAITTEPDGISTQSYTNPDATPASPDLTGTVQPDGADTIETSSGDSSSVNVDPGSDNSGDNGSGDGGAGGGSGGTGGGTGGGSGGTGGGSGGAGGGSGGGSGGS